MLDVQDVSRRYGALTAYLIGVLVFTKGVPRLEILLFDYPRAAICSAFLFVVVAVAHRYRLLRRSGSDAGEADVTSAGELLGLN